MTGLPSKMLPVHDVRLVGPPVVLRPMSESDWDVILAWNNDPDVLCFSDGDDVRSRTLDEVQRIYRSVCSHAFCFIIEYEDRPIGECWLQEMNLQTIVERHPGLDLRRIDIAIGEPQLWGRGLGTEAVRLLVDLGFERENCDAIYACSVADTNPRSRRMFKRLGFVVDTVNPLPTSSKAATEYDLVLTRERYRDAT